MLSLDRTRLLLYDSPNRCTWFTLLDRAHGESQNPSVVKQHIHIVFFQLIFMKFKLVLIPSVRALLYCRVTLFVSQRKRARDGSRKMDAAQRLRVARSVSVC